MGYGIRDDLNANIPSTKIVMVKCFWYVWRAINKDFHEIDDLK